ncbi:hypothetical protein BpHYR1_053096 [Brachionus plicatilis]|uniref:Uncharacterized protein n=1 Tax=Brachionus plicatilis TaxID=10195 RepID=A0A3M7R3W7_BRAPC|nr:hypothetical protein BpHYR1_053096 [Brachionus plicatilis]
MIRDLLKALENSIPAVKTFSHRGNSQEPHNKEKGFRISKRICGIPHICRDLWKNVPKKITDCHVKYINNTFANRSSSSNDLESGAAHCSNNNCGSRRRVPQQAKYLEVTNQTLDSQERLIVHIERRLREEEKKRLKTNNGLRGYFNFGFGPRVPIKLIKNLIVFDPKPSSPK